VSTVTADSPPRQPICRFTVSRPPPFRLSFHLYSALYRCVFPVGFSEAPWPTRGLRSGLTCEAPWVVLRGFVYLPLSAQGQHYVFYLLFTTGGVSHGGTVSHPSAAAVNMAAMAGTLTPEAGTMVAAASTATVTATGGEMVAAVSICSTTAESGTSSHDRHPERAALYLSAGHQDPSSARTKVARSHSNAAFSLATP
jgi:hypothetical protein